MARIEIKLGTPPSGNDGDPVRTAFEKVNTMTSELYTLSPSADSPLPITRGGTGANTQAGARNALALKSAALADVGYEPGQVPPALAVGRTSTTSDRSWLTNNNHGLDDVLYTPSSPEVPAGGTGYWYKYTFRHATTTNRLIMAWSYGLAGNTGTMKFRSIYDGALTPELEMIHTGNAERDPSIGAGVVWSGLVGGFVVTRYAGGDVMVRGDAPLTATIGANSTVTLTVNLPITLVNGSLGFALGGIVNCLPTTSLDIGAPIAVNLDTPTRISFTVKNGAVAQTIRPRIIIWGRWK